MHAQLFHRGFFQDQALQAESLGQLFGFVCQIGGGTDVAGQVAQVSRQIHALDNCSTLSDGIGHGFGGLAGSEYRHCFQFDRLCLWRGLEAIEAIRTFTSQHNGLAQPSAGRKPVYIKRGQGIDCISGRGAQHRIEGSAIRLHPVFAVQFVRFAQPDQDQTGSLEALWMTHDEGGAGFAGKVALLLEAADQTVAGLVCSKRCGRLGTAFKDT